jgi:metallo-beta-lactamase family protein
MEIEFAGAAREVTGSCHIVRMNGKTVLLDFGMFQGRRSETRAKNAALPLAVREIDAVVLSHAHIDHAGRLPLLTANGYANPIYCTAATRDLSAVMLADSAHIQEKDAEFLAKRQREAVPPLYGMRDATTAVDRMVGLPYDTWFDVAPGMRATFSDAGHILGSASVTLECVEAGTRKRIVFSGDVGRNGLPIIRDPKPPTGGADVVILESTYGNRTHPPVAGARDQLARVVSETAARWRPRAGAGILGGSYAGTRLRSAHPGARGEDPRGADLHRQSAGDRRDHRVRNASRDLRSDGGPRSESSGSVQVPARALHT